ncbi:hypothetical protein [Pseudoalteromonas sp. SR45-4]|uniref:hypothetical protein n=1 Tax=Pseudoalteromonas sp. SR45-4 TaxID=2760929 RepID=UPI0015F977D8|nr:hypothetical protein [Pseudoalteromonas sp. SR45-4]MBB1371379.1 hypothetical protein [Pseudoalteromonas sp. SR45-4]
MFVLGIIVLLAVIVCIIFFEPQPPAKYKYCDFENELSLEQKNARKVVIQNHFHISHF